MPCVPEYAGKIAVFVSSDSDKLHSLAEFDIISTRDLSQHLIAEQIKCESNTPTHNFWAALAENADYFSFDAICDFVSSVQNAQDQSEAIPANMWRLNLLSDSAILSIKGHEMLWVYRKASEYNSSVMFTNTNTI